MYKSQRNSSRIRSDIWPAAGRSTVFFAALAVINGCAATGESGSTPGTLPRVSLIASHAGVVWSRTAASGMVIKIGDFEGTNDTFTWPSQALANTDSLAALDTCLDNFRMQVRFASSQSREQPHFIRSGVVGCIERSGVSGYVNTRERDSTVYDVEFTTGNVNDSVAPERGAPLVSSGGPHLGALRHIRAGAAPATVAIDVQACRDQAAAAGVFTTTRMSSSPDSSGRQASYGSTTIQPMLDRFDGCLRGRGYGVEPANSQTRQ